MVIISFKVTERYCVDEGRSKISQQVFVSCFYVLSTMLQKLNPKDILQSWLSIILIILIMLVFLSTQIGILIGHPIWEPSIFNWPNLKIFSQNRNTRQSVNKALELFKTPMTIKITGRVLRKEWNISKELNLVSNSSCYRKR